MLSQVMALLLVVIFTYKKVPAHGINKEQGLENVNVPFSVTSS